MPLPRFNTNRNARVTTQPSQPTVSIGVYRTAPTETTTLRGTLTPEQQLAEATRKIEEAISKMKDATSPKISVEGITLSTGVSPVVARSDSSSATVSIVQDSSDDELKQKIVRSSIGPQPVVLSAVKLPEISASDMDDAIEVNQFERQIVKESVARGLSAALDKDPKGLGTIVKEKSSQQIENIKGQISAVSYMQDTANTAATGLDVVKISSQIMQRASDALGTIVQPSELANKPIPRNIDEYISLTFPNEALRLGVDGYLTNTSRIVVIAQDMLLAAISAHPTVLQNFSRNSNSEESLAATSLFTPPGAYGYDPDGPGVSDLVQIPINTLLCAPNDRSIISAFRQSSADASVRPNNGILNKGNIDTVDEAWDTILHMITCISNEMITSAGIGRLQGSQLGSRFIETSPSNTKQFSPYSKVLGFSPSDSSDRISQFFKSGPDRPGSLLDYLALGEEAENEDFIVMPFETNTVISEGKPYVSGRKYFVDLAVQADGPSAVTHRSALKRFSSDFVKFTNDMSSYLTELLALTVETSLAPHLLTARVMQDFSSVLSSLDRPASDVDKKSCAVASLFVFAGNSPDSSVRLNERGSISVTASDMIKMSVVKALKDFDRLSTDSTFSLSDRNSSYQLDSSTLENPETNLSYTIKSFTDQALSNAPDRPETVSRTSYTYERSTEFLHDVNFSSQSNLINLIARTIREIQKEALNLAQRNGAKVDYRNSSKGTLLSDCDDDRFIDIVCELYQRIAYLVLPVSVFKRQRSTTSTGGTGRDFDFVMDYNAQNVRVGSTLISSLVSSLINGSEITPASAQYESLINVETPINVVETGDNTIVTKCADICLAVSRLVKHRYYIKSSMKVIESIAAGASAASAKMTSIFDILNGSVKPEKLKDQEKVLYEMFVTNRSKNLQFLTNISDQQTNLCTVSLYNYVSDGDVYIRKDVDTSRSERLAMRDFVKSVYEKDGVDDLYLMSVGLPGGMIESLYRPAINVESSDLLQAAARGTEGDKRGRIIRIEIDRYDEAHYNAVGSVETDIYGRSPSPTEFDPEIFIFPDSISYDPDNKPSGAVSVLDAIFQTTTFYRVRGGVVIEKTPGNLVETGQERVYVNALRSYLLDMYLYETARIRYKDGTGLYGPPTLSKEGYDLVKAISTDNQLSRLAVNTTGFAKLFDEKTYSIKTGSDLKSLLKPRSSNRSPEFYSTDVLFASTLASMFPLFSLPVIMNRPFERIYNFLYDESIVRNNISGDDIARKRKRRQFDLYTLALRVSYGGGQ